MPCFRPLSGYRSKLVNPTTGKRGITFSKREAASTDPVDQITLPCGQCRHCRLEHSRQWAMRCVHEASLYDNNCFLTLTYSDEFLPQNNSLDYDAPVLFMKRLRKQFGEGIRSYGCAEYGDLLQRPHYHLCIFNFDFTDKKHLKTVNEHKIYSSETLSLLWPFGHSSIGSLTFESAAYVARYCTKKITGARAKTHYEVVDPSSGEVFERAPERAICVSRRPGLGRTWYEQNAKYTQTFDHVILRGKKLRPTKYYDRLFDLADPAAFKETKAIRKEKGVAAARLLAKEDEQGYAKFHAEGGFQLMKIPPRPRLYVMEDVQELKFQQLKRTLENG